MTRKYALIGSSIRDSASPELFRAAYGGKYPYDLLEGPDFNPLFESFVREYCAVNVTAPFKEAALAKADEVSDAALLCQAANMLIKLPDGKILADNSDFEGVTLSILSALAMSGEDVDVDDEEALSDYLAEKTALVAGIGGAGKAAAAAAVTLGYGKTTLINRTPGRAGAMKKHLCGFYEDLTDDELEVLPLEEFPRAFAEADLVIYTIPEKIEGIAQIDRNCLGKNKFILEANYKTPSLDIFSGSCTYISGLNWLLNQAIVSYEAFTGQAPDEEAMHKIKKIQ